VAAGPRPVTRVALLSSEPIRPSMGGIGIRYLELARRLPAAGFDVVLLSPATIEESTRCGLPAERIRQATPGGLARATADRDVAVAQGQLANDLLLARPDLPVAIDLYDPWLVENLHYLDALGLDPYRNDHATWVLQLARGDFFLCSSEEQRLFYLGFLAALGRVNPESVAEDPTLERLIAPVPFGLPDALPEHRPYLPEAASGERRLLFGGLYDWYDPWTALAALERLAPAARLYFIRNPNPESTPQRRFRELERELARRPELARRVVALEWVPAERRFDLLRDVDLLVSPHRPGLETDLALRTRFLEALAAGCPTVATAGGTAARLLTEHGAGWVTPPGDAAALGEALEEALAGGEVVAAKRRAGLALAARFRWRTVLAPLVRFLESPRLEPTKERFAFRPPTLAPADGLRRRIARRLRRPVG